MKNVVTYDVYLDILLVGSIYVTTYVCSKENLKSLLSWKPRHPGLGTGMHYWIGVFVYGLGRFGLPLAYPFQGVPRLSMSVTYL